jgi:thiol-disulfide isomerase/thioredoxin
VRALLLVLLAGCSAAARDPSAPITPIELRGTPFDRGLLHFWATDCAPCRDELPALLEVSRDERVPVIAIATDADWSRVEAFFEREVPSEVVRDEAGFARTLGVATLPDTYVVDRGRATRRIAGAIDWRKPSTRAWLTTWKPAR